MSTPSTSSPTKAPSFSTQGFRTFPGTSLITDRPSTIQGKPAQWPKKEQPLYLIPNLNPGETGIAVPVFAVQRSANGDDYQILKQFSLYHKPDGPHSRFINCQA